MTRENIDHDTVSGFGDEWTRFDQEALSKSDQEQTFAKYFSLFPWSELPKGAEGFDLGCGSGRWAQLVGPRVGKLHCIDASADALAVAKKKLFSHENCDFFHASVDAIPLADESMDFGYSLGVLHHVPDTGAGIRACVRKLKRGAPFLIYLYYALDGRPAWFRAVFQASDLLRRRISKLPHGARFAVSQAIAAGVYFPLARACKVGEALGRDMSSMPLYAYRDRSFYFMRTDALDRFGTQLEQRFTRAQIERMMLAAGLKDVRFRDEDPYWCAIGYRE